jgi:large subunit ribosomal protein L13
MKTIFVNQEEATRKWYLIDAAGKNLGRTAVKTVQLLRGKHKPEYAPHQETGDYVVIVNADKVQVTGDKMRSKKYYRHSGYPGGMRSETLEKMIIRKPVFPLEHAIKGMLPKNRLGRKLFKNVKVYTGSSHPHGAQKPEKIEID